MFASTIGEAELPEFRGINAKVRGHLWNRLDKAQTGGTDKVVLGTS